MSHYKTLIHEIKYVIDTKHYFCQKKPEVNLNVPWEICGYIHLGYARDNGTREILTGCIIIINRVVITCLSQSQKTVTMPVTKYVY